MKQILQLTPTQRFVLSGLEYCSEKKKRNFNTMVWSFLAGVLFTLFIIFLIGVLPN